MRKFLIPVALASVGLMALTACAQSSAADATTSAATSASTQSADSTNETSVAETSSANTSATNSSDTNEGSSATPPAPFDGAPVKVSLVRQSGEGDYFQQWGAGAAAQAKAANIDLTISDARNDNASEASNMAQAIASKPAAIIIDHGLTETMQPLVTQAVQAGIKVIVYDLDLTDDTGVLSVTQSDQQMADGVLKQMITDVGDGAKVGYVSATGYAALDARAVVWNKYVKDHHLGVLFSTGKVTDSTATDNIPLVSAALTQNPSVQAIFAPYDEIAKGATQAIIQSNMQGKVRVYGMDISNADLQVMLASNSPWVATSATDPAAVGATVVRILALSLTGALTDQKYELPAQTLTQDKLRAANVTNMQSLRQAFPALLNEDLYVAGWLKAVSS